MDEHIIALLNNNLRVIIPDFGAFIVRQKEPRIIVFNEFLRYNDGLLIDFIGKTEQIEKEIAEQQVTDFAEEASKILASGKELQIKGLGWLNRDSSGKVNFISEASHAAKEKSLLDKETAKSKIKSDAIKVAAATSKSNAVKQGPDRKSPSSGKASVKSPAKEAARNQDAKKEAPRNQDAEKEAARNRDAEKETLHKDLKDKTVSGTAEKSETNDDNKPGRKEKPELKTKSIAESGTEAGSGTVTQTKPESAAQAEKRDESKTRTGPKPESAAEAKISPGDKPKSEQTVKSGTKTGEGSEPKTESETAQEVRTPGRAGVDDRSAQRAQMASSAANGSRSALHGETAKTQPSQKIRRTASSNQLLIWIVVILLVNIIILAWFLYREDIRQLFGKGQRTVLVLDSLDAEEPVSSDFETTGDALEPAVEEFPAIEETPVKEEPATSPARTPSGQPRFYIVAGCFSEEANADALVTSLRARGFSAEKFGRIGNLHAVSYASFDNRTDALRELERIRSEAQPDAWMTRF
ncbi:MAG: SPOR domain-containing protein [Bacteroidales bacterium]|nr:SPOR domain-containing protein [Bacteroidales bacterium]